MIGMIGVLNAIQLRYIKAIYPVTPYIDNNTKELRTLQVGILKVYKLSDVITNWQIVYGEPTEEDEIKSLARIKKSSKIVNKLYTTMIIDKIDEDAGYGLTVWGCLEHKMLYRLDDKMIPLEQLNNNFYGSICQIIDIAKKCPLTVESYYEMVKAKMRAKTKIEELDYLIIECFGYREGYEDFKAFYQKPQENTSDREKRKNKRRARFKLSNSDEIGVEHYRQSIKSQLSTQEIKLSNEKFNGHSIINILANETGVSIHSSTQRWLDTHNFSFIIPISFGRLGTVEYILEDEDKELTRSAKEAVKFVVSEVTTSL